MVRREVLIVCILYIGGHGEISGVLYSYVTELRNCPDTFYCFIVSLSIIIS